MDDTLPPAGVKREVILVEPGAHLTYGHYQEKLGLWAGAFRAADWSVSVTCWQVPEEGRLDDVDYFATPALPALLSRLLPYRVRVLWMVFATYLLAFRRAMRGESHVLGCTTSSLLPVTAARTLSRINGRLFAQIVMYGDMFDQQSPRARRLARWSLVNLLGAGSAVLPNTMRTRSKFIEQVEDTSLHARIKTLYDPIYISPKHVPDEVKSPELPFLICGLDGGRRTPLAHLERARLDPAPHHIQFHLPGCTPEDQVGVRSKGAPFASKVSVSTGYLIRDDLHDLCACASCCFLAYHQSASQGSGFLAQSLIAGTPVLSSRFPHALELFEQFGRLGELFEFDNPDSLRNAWSRLRDWGLQQWAEFHAARRQLTEQVDPHKHATTIIQLFQHTPVGSVKDS